MAHQPTKDEAYETSGNPVSKEPKELLDSQNEPKGTVQDRRVSGDQPQDPVPTSLGYGVTGAGPGEEVQGKTEEDIGRHNELDGGQMAAPGEGKVHDAVTGTKPGASGQQPDLASDLDRKKHEQATAREAVQHRRETGEDVGGAVGQQPGPAMPGGPN